jgi:hypothetical protein
MLSHDNNPINDTIHWLLLPGEMSRSRFDVKAMRYWESLRFSLQQRAAHFSAALSLFTACGFGHTQRRDPTCLAWLLPLASSHCSWSMQKTSSTPSTILL